MKSLWLLLLCIGALSATNHAKELTNEDRKALITNLAALSETADSVVNEKYGVALTAFRNAANSDTAAIELYLNCLEKVDFDDQQKKAQGFREWKRTNSAALADNAFHQALRYQLNWLILTLQATAPKPDSRKIASTAEALVDAIFLDAEKLAGQEKLLSEPITASVFARAYGLTSLKIKDWPLAAAELSTIYEQLLLPPQRTANQTEAIRILWLKRIKQESLKSDFWGKPADTASLIAADHSAGYQHFIAVTAPQLVWEMEVDLFQHGDERDAATRMLNHIQKFIGHPLAKEWTKKFQSLLAPKPIAPTPPAEVMPAR